MTCSEKLVCFAMANYFVRVCSVYGTQKGVLLVPGPVISMAASGYQLLIAYHSAAPRKGDQCISTMLVKLEGKIAHLDNRPGQTKLCNCLKV